MENKGDKKIKIIWQDIFTLSDTNLKAVKKKLGKTGVSESHGELVLEDDRVIVLKQNTAKGLEEADDFIIIPKSIIIRREK